VTTHAPARHQPSPARANSAYGYVDRIMTHHRGQLTEAQLGDIAIAERCWHYCDGRPLPANEEDLLRDAAALVASLWHALAYPTIATRYPRRGRAA
jgi:hypothetical protein